MSKNWNRSVWPSLRPPCGSIVWGSECPRYQIVGSKKVFVGRKPCKSLRMFLQWFSDAQKQQLYLIKNNVSEKHVNLITIVNYSILEN